MGPNDDLTAYQDTSMSEIVPFKPDEVANSQPEPTRPVKTTATWKETGRPHADWQGQSSISQQRPGLAPETKPPLPTPGWMETNWKKTPAVEGQVNSMTDNGLTHQSSSNAGSASKGTDGKPGHNQGQEEP